MSKKIKILLLAVLVLIAGSGVAYYYGGDALVTAMRKAPIIRGIVGEREIKSRKDFDKTAIQRRTVEVSKFRGEFFDEEGKFKTKDPTEEQMKNLKKYLEDMKEIKEEWHAAMKVFYEKYFKNTQFMSGGEDGKGEWYEDEEPSDEEPSDEEPSDEEPSVEAPTGLDIDDYYDADGKFDFFGYAADYIDLYMYKPENFPPNYVWVFPFNMPSFDVDIGELSPENPHVASNFIACTLGDQAAMVNSVAFDLYGASSGQAKFEVKAYTMDGEMDILDYPIMTWIGNWPGDINFPYQVSLDPGECMGFHIRYLGVYGEDDPVYKPLWSQFTMRGLGSSLPAYFIAYNTDMVKLKDAHFSNVRGALNVFEPGNALLVHGNVDDSNHPVKEDNYWLAYFNIESFPNTKGHVDSVDLFLNTDFGEDIEVTANIYKEQRAYYYNGPKSEFSAKEFILSPGLNTLDLDVDLGYAEQLRVDMYGYIDPPGAGDVSVDLVDVGYDGDLYEGYYGWYPAINDMNSEFDGMEGFTLHFEDQETLPFVTVNSWPHGPYVEWYSENDFEEPTGPDDYWMPPIAHIEFQHSSLSDGYAPMEIGDLELDVIGNFYNPVNLKVKTFGQVYEEDGDFVYQGEEEEFYYSVLPGDSIPVGGFDLYGGTNRGVEVYMDEFPYQDGQAPVIIRLKIDELSAHFIEPGENFSEGDEVAMRIWDEGAEEYTFNYEFPLLFSKAGFAPVLLYKTQDLNTPYQMVFLSDWAGNDEGYVMNNVCFHAQGGATVYSFTYTHMNREQSPFEEVRLDAGSNIIYLDLEADWEVDEATFHLTNPVGYNNSDFCLNLTVALPEEELTEAWFDLVGIEATNDAGDPVAVFETFQPPNNNIELSPVHSIQGPKVDFYNF